jgi:hypothetical protein
MSADSTPSPEMQVAFEKARAVKRAHESELLSRPNVIGVGVGLRRQGGARTNTVALVVLVTQKLPEAALAPKDVIPAEIEGVPVDVQEVGTIKAQ